MGLKESGLRGSLRNVSVGIDAIPDTLEVQYDPSQQSLLDDDDVPTRVDQVGSRDATGSGTYKTEVQNGEPVVRYDGSQSHTIPASEFDTIPEPFSVIAVVVDAEQTSNIETILGSESSGDNDVQIRWNDAWEIVGGSTVTGSETNAPLIISAIFDGENSKLRENSSETASGGSDSGGMESLSIGQRQGDRGWDGDSGELNIYFDNIESTDDLVSEENRLAEKYGIPIE